MAKNFCEAGDLYCTPVKVDQVQVLDWMVCFAET